MGAANASSSSDGANGPVSVYCPGGDKWGGGMSEVCKIGGGCLQLTKPAPPMTVVQLDTQQTLATNGTTTTVGAPIQTEKQGEQLFGSAGCTVKTANPELCTELYYGTTIENAQDILAQGHFPSEQLELRLTSEPKAVEDVKGAEQGVIIKLLAAADRITVSEDKAGQRLPCVDAYSLPQDVGVWHVKNIQDAATPIAWRYSDNNEWHSPNTLPSLSNPSTVNFQCGRQDQISTISTYERVLGLAAESAWSSQHPSPRDSTIDFEMGRTCTDSVVETETTLIE